jgi:hypothetical protein
MFIDIYDGEKIVYTYLWKSYRKARWKKKGARLLKRTLVKYPNYPAVYIRNCKSPYAE